MSEPVEVKPEYLSPAKASVLLDIPEGTLERLRASGEGPRWVRAGARLVRYPVAGLHEWMASRPSSEDQKDERQDDQHGDAGEAA